MRIGGGIVFSGIVLITVSVAVSLWLCSGALRSVALRQRWWEGSLGSLVLKLAAGVVLGASVAQAVTAALLLPALALGWVQLPGGHADYQWSSVLLYWMNTALFLLVWTGLWGACTACGGHATASWHACAPKPNAVCWNVTHCVRGSIRISCSMR